jgi:hypothetical protein
VTPRPRRAIAGAALAAARIAALLAAALLAAGCAHHGSAPDAAPRAVVAERPALDSLAVALWSMDEETGSRVSAGGSGGLDGTAGMETRTDYGRFGRARSFTRSLDSFVLVPAAPELETGAAFTIEAWINPRSYGDYEDTPIAARWIAQKAQFSWLFTMVGRQLIPPVVPSSSPGDHLEFVRGRAIGALAFVFQPEDAGAPRVFVSTRSIDLNRWTHVAASYDGATVRLWINGVLDAQYVSPGRIRRSDAPLEIGNALDPRWLSAFGGDLRATRALDPSPYYAFDGWIDEVRLSRAARSRFEGLAR